MAPSAAKTGKRAVQQETAEPRNRKPFEPIASGWYDAVISSAVGTFYKSGAFGIKVAYTITGEGSFKKRQMFENIVLRLADGSDNEAAKSIFLKRLDAAGLTSEEVDTFVIPKNGKEDGDLGKLKGAPIRLKVDLDKYNPTYKNADGLEVTNMRVVAVAYKNDSEDGPEAA